ncbi:MAG: hypothetical protein QM768_21790 [Agriterribacter sp.]
MVTQVKDTTITRIWHKDSIIHLPMSQAEVLFGKEGVPGVTCDIVGEAGSWGNCTGGGVVDADTLKSLPIPETAYRVGYDIVDTIINAGRVKLSIKKEANSLRIKCTADSLSMVIAGLNKEIFQLRSVKTDVPIAVPDPQPFIPRWVWYAIGILAAAAAWGNRRLIIGLFKIITGWVA